MNIDFKYDIVGVYVDTYLNKSYKLVITTAQSLKEYLLLNYGKLGIDVKRFNLHKKYDGDEDTVTPPIEIYEYQNFFLMERADDYLLLDGFRRLIWYDAPNHPIYVRIYQESDMTKPDIMKMLIYLNNFKFHTGGNFYDRGFALALYTLYDINIPKMEELFQAYLVQSKTERNSRLHRTLLSGTRSITNSFKLMNDPLFVDNIKFLYDISKTKQITNSFFAVLFREFMNDYKKPFTANEFLSVVNDNVILNELLVKLTKNVRAHESHDNIKQILEIYKTVFDSFLGVDTEKPYALQLSEIKQQSKDLQKDKTWIKLTNKQSLKEEIRKMFAHQSEGGSFNFKVVAYPYNNNSNYSDNLGTVPSGVYDVIKFSIAKNIRQFRREFDVEMVIETGHHIQSSDFKQINRLHDSTVKGVSYMQVDCDVFVQYI